MQECLIVLNEILMGKAIISFGVNYFRNSKPEDYRLKHVEIKGGVDD